MTSAKREQNRICRSSIYRIIGRRVYLKY